MRQELTIATPYRFRRAVLVDPLAAFTVQKDEQFPYADGELNVVSSGEWISRGAGGTAQVVSAKYDLTAGAGEYIIDFTNPAYFLQNNINRAVQFFMQFTPETTGTNSNSYGAGFSTDPPSLTTRQQVTCGLNVAGTDYEISSNIFGSSTLHHTTVADGLLHEVSMIWTINGPTYDVTIYLDDVLIGTRLAALNVSAVFLSMYMNGNITNTIPPVLSPRGCTRVQYWHQP